MEAGILLCSLRVILRGMFFEEDHAMMSTVRAGNTECESLEAVTDTTRGRRGIYAVTCWTIADLVARSE